MTATKVKTHRWKCKCNKCGTEWMSRGEELPVICSNCKSVRWNKPRKERKEK